MRIVIVGLLGAVLLLTGMVSAALAQREEVRPPRLKLASTAFRDAGPLPLAYTCYAEGGNAVSPPLQWSFAPEDTASFTVMVVAPDNHQGGSLTQAFFWVRWNIPASTTALPQNVPLGAELPDGSRQVEGRGFVGYRAPCAPPGVGALHYQFKLYALDQMLTLPANATREDVLNAIDGHIVGASSYYGTIERSADGQ